MTEQYKQDYIKDIISIFKKYKIDSIAYGRGLGLTFKLLGKGVFRKAYRVNNLPLVAKFPLSKDACDVEHSVQEMATLERIRHTKKLREAFEEHLPEIYYYNKKYGVILMKEYDQPLFFDYPRDLKDKLNNLLDYFDADNDQFGVDENGNLIVLDWGLVGDKLREWNKVGYKSYT